MTMKSFQEMENHFHEDEDDQRKRHHKGEHLQKSSKDHVCKVCGKRFETGNGLGGHTRIHNLLLPKKKISKQLYHPSSRDYWKDVRLLRALSVSPSQSSSATSSSSCESSPSDLTESDCDLEKSLPSWGKKDVRGRSSTSTSSTSASSLSAYQTVPNKPREAAKIKADETSWSDKIVKPKMKMMMRSNSEKSRKHVCDICSKEFRTGQALGGHKSSHFYYAGATSVRVHQVVCDEDEDDEEEEASTPVTNPKTLEFDLNQLPPSEGTGS